MLPTCSFSIQIVSSPGPDTYTQHAHVSVTAPWHAAAVIVTSLARIRSLACTLFPVTYNSNVSVCQRQGHEIAPHCIADEDEQSKREIKDILMQYDRTLLVADPRRCEPKKYALSQAALACLACLEPLPLLADVCTQHSLTGYASLLFVILLLSWQVPV